MSESGKKSAEQEAVIDQETVCRLLSPCEFKGVKFCDISPLLADPKALDYVCQKLASKWTSHRVDAVAGLEARGFIFGPLIARYLGTGFVQLRKPGKLPGETLSVAYAKEYGTDTIEVQKSAIRAGQRILVVDDILATGGTLIAACKLIELAGGVAVGCAVVAEIESLGGMIRICEQTPVRQFAIITKL